MSRFLRIFAIILGLQGSLTAESLRIFSYNIKHGQGMDGKIDLERIAAVIAKEKPDLVALQEVDVNCTRSGNIDIAAELGRLLKMEHRFSKSIDLQGGEYGVAVLSRLPVIKAIRHVLPGEGEPRTALEVQVNGGSFGDVISFVSIHNDWQKEETRVMQVGAILAALKETTHPVILAGDFNGETDDASVQLIAQKPWQLLDKKGEKTCPSDVPKVEIDFFAIRGFGALESKCRVIEEKVASDHRPIVAELSGAGAAD